MSHTSFENLHQKILGLEKEIPTGSMWIHFKDQKAEHPYIVLNLALEEASGEIVVIYKREDRSDSFCWSRPVFGEKGWLSKSESGLERFTRLQINTK
jgi:hypothetical protein